MRTSTKTILLGSFALVALFGSGALLWQEYGYRFKSEVVVIPSSTTRPKQEATAGKPKPELKPVAAITAEQYAAIKADLKPATLPRVAGAAAGLPSQIAKEAGASAVWVDWLFEWERAVEDGKSMPAIPTREAFVAGASHITSPAELQLLSAVGGAITYAESGLRTLSLIQATCDIGSRILMTSTADRSDLSNAAIALSALDGPLWAASDGSSIEILSSAIIPYLPTLSDSWRWAKLFQPGSLYMQGRYDEALREVQRLSEDALFMSQLSPDQRGELAWIQGLCLCGAGRTDLSIISLRTAFDIKEFHHGSDAAKMLIKLLSETGRFDEVDQIYEQWVFRYNAVPWERTALLSVINQNRRMFAVNRE